MKKQFRELIRDESAQGATEYVLMLAVVVAVVLLFRVQIMDAAKGIIGKLTDQLNQFKAVN